MINLIAIRYAIMVAEKKSFTSAAEALGVKQSMVSRRIRALEDEIGVALFERGSKGTTLTNAGRKFINKCRLALDDINLAVQAAAKAGIGEEGSIKIGVEASLSNGFMRDLISDYKNRYPHVSIQILEGALREQIIDLTERNIDFAFTFTRPSKSAYDVDVFWNSSNYVILPINHALADRPSIAWDDIKDEHFIVSAGAAGAGVDEYIIKHSRQFGLSPSLERYKVSRETLINLVGIGFGITVVSEASAAIKIPGTILKKIANNGDQIKCYGAWLPQNDNPAFRRFLNLARSMSNVKKQA
jgi:DNA-binding transcriptional LysR family regulator